MNMILFFLLYLIAEDLFKFANGYSLIYLGLVADALVSRTDPRSIYTTSSPSTAGLHSWVHLWVHLPF